MTGTATDRMGWKAASGTRPRRRGDPEKNGHRGAWVSANLTTTGAVLALLVPTNSQHRVPPPEIARHVLTQLDHLTDLPTLGPAALRKATTASWALDGYAFRGGDAGLLTRVDERLRDLTDRFLGLDHPDALTARNNLANAYARAGRTAEATTLHGRARPFTRTCRARLADAYRGAGRVEDVERVDAGA